MSPFWPGAVAHAVATTTAATTAVSAQAAQLLLDTTSTVRAARALEQGGSLPGGRRCSAGVDRGDRLDLDRHAERQLAGADRRSGVAARVAPHGQDELAEPVDG